MTAKGNSNDTDEHHHLIGAAGPIPAALFPTDPIATPPDAMTTGGMIHALGAVLGDGIPIAATLLTLSLIRNNPTWSSVVINYP